MKYDTIKITLQISEIKLDKNGKKEASNRAFCPEKDIREVATFIEINGLDINHFSDWFAFVSYSHDNRSYDEIENDTEGDPELSSFEPFTCSCGIGGCAGIYDGIYSRHDEQTVEWNVTDEVTKKLLGKRYFSFDKNQYETEVKKIHLWLAENKELIIYDGTDNGHPLSEMIQNIPVKNKANNNIAHT